MEWRQYVVHEDEPRLMRFEVSEAWWYVSDKGIIWAENNLEALSKYWTI